MQRVKIHKNIRVSPIRTELVFRHYAIRDNSDLRTIMSFLCGRLRLLPIITAKAFALAVKFGLVFVVNKFIEIIEESKKCETTSTTLKFTTYVYEVKRFNDFYS